MKVFVKVFSLVILAGILFASCSRTRDAIGLDTIENMVKAGRWTIFDREVYTPPNSSTAVKTDMLADGQYLKFESGGVAKVHNSDGAATTTSYNYSFTDTKTIVFDGVTYKIQETLVGSSSKMTLVNETAVAKTVYILQR